MTIPVSRNSCHKRQSITWQQS